MTLISIEDRRLDSATKRGLLLSVLIDKNEVPRWLLKDPWSKWLSEIDWRFHTWEKEDVLDKGCGCMPMQILPLYTGFKRWGAISLLNFQILAPRCSQSIIISVYSIYWGMRLWGGCWTVSCKPEPIRPILLIVSEVQRYKVKAVTFIHGSHDLSFRSYQASPRVVSA